jgi:hypothetical protein
MAAGGGKADLQDRIEIRVDPDAEPADWDRAVAQFLLACVCRQATIALGRAGSEPADLNRTSAADDSDG